MISSLARSSSQTQSISKDQPPNFLIILADDLGYGDLACYGNKIIQTTHLDQLAAEGMLLTDCYASAPMCSPSRAGLLTGRVPYRTGIYDWIAPDSSMNLPQKELSIATYLRQHGYTTSHIGKWHLNGKLNSTEQTQPYDHGFDYWFSTQYSLPHKDPDGFICNGYPEREIEGYSCQIVARETADWLKNKRDKRKPFFQFVSFHEPHEPIMSPPELTAQYKEQGKKAEYYANVTNLDRAVGDIMDALEEEGILENTVLVFTSDNGPAEYTPNGYFNKSHGSAGPLRGYKRHQFEGGIRVPGIIRWPGKIVAASQSETPVSNVDFFPTFCQLAGIDLPTDRKIDGTDISPLFSGKEIQRKNPLHWHFYDPWGGPQSLLRKGDWILGAAWNVGDFHEKGRFDPQKELPLIKSTELQDFSLYNIREDIHQDQDVAKEYPKITKRLSDHLISLHKEVAAEAPFPQGQKFRSKTSKYPAYRIGRQWP